MATDHLPGPDDGLLLAYEDSADRVPVLWIHGYPLHGALWDFQIDGLSEIARQITPDLRGHGLTEPTAPPYSMAMLADDCARLLDHLGFEGPVVVGGLSMGGYVAFELLRRHRPRIAGLILAATRAGADSDAGRTARDEAADKAIAMGVGAVVDGMLPKLLAPRTYDRQPDLVAFVRDMMCDTTTDGVVGALAAMRDRQDSTEDLAGIDVPTLIVHGAEDQLIPVAEAEVMQEGITGARLVLIPEAGHLPNLEQPEQFNEAVREFLLQFYDG